MLINHSHTPGMQITFPSSCSGATPVQPKYQNMENIDPVDKITLACGTGWIQYNHKYRVNEVCDPSKSKLFGGIWG